MKIINLNISGMIESNSVGHTSYIMGIVNDSIRKARYRDLTWVINIEPGTYSIFI